MAWSARDIVALSDKYRGTFTERGGNWGHSFPNSPLVDSFGYAMTPRAEELMREEFYARLRESADEVKQYLTNMDPAQRRRSDHRAEKAKVAADREMRAELIDKARAKARKLGRGCWWTAIPCAMGNAFDDVPDAAVLVTVEGLTEMVGGRPKVIEASEWVRLPALPPPPPDKSRYKKKRKRGRNSPGSGTASGALFAESTPSSRPT